MTGITSAQFRDQNQILAHHRVLGAANALVPAPPTGRDYAVDMDDDGKVATRHERDEMNAWFRSGWPHGQWYGYYQDSERQEEPVVAFDELRTYAASHGTQMVVQGDMPVPVSRVSAESLHRPYDYPSYHRDSQPAGTADDLARQCAPFDKDAHWAFDTQTNEFLVFVPKALATSKGVAAAEFRAANHILSSHKIIHAETVNVPTHGPQYAVDVVGDQHLVTTSHRDESVQSVMDDGRVSVYRDSIKLGDPVIPYADIQQWATNHGTQIVQQGDIAFHLLERQSEAVHQTTANADGLYHTVDKEASTAEELARYLNSSRRDVPWGVDGTDAAKDIRWAIDTTTGEFLVFTPGPA